MESGLFHTRPIRSRVVRFEMTASSRLRHRGYHRLHQLTLRLRIQRYSECPFSRTTGVVQHCALPRRIPVQRGQGLCFVSCWTQSSAKVTNESHSLQN